MLPARRMRVTLASVGRERNDPFLKVPAFKILQSIPTFSARIHDATVEIARHPEEVSFEGDLWTGRIFVELSIDGVSFDLTRRLSAMHIT